MFEERVNSRERETERSWVSQLLSIFRQGSVVKLLVSGHDWRESAGYEGRSSKARFSRGTAQAERELKQAVVMAMREARWRGGERQCGGREGQFLCLDCWGRRPRENGREAVDNRKRSMEGGKWMRTGDELNFVDAIKNLFLLDN